VDRYYIKKNVEKRVKLDEWKTKLYEGNTYIRILNQTTFLRKDINGLKVEII
jgi:hypothetical protein